MSTKNRIFIVDDEEYVREGLKSEIQTEADLQVIGLASNGFEALESILANQPDLVLMDVQMPGMDGIECIKWLRASDFGGIILILTAYADDHYVVEGLANGATGYLLKMPDHRSIVKVIREAMNNQYILPSEIAAKVVRYIKENDQSSKLRSLTALSNRYALSRREQELIPMLLNRLSNKEISAIMHVSEGTVKNYLTVLYNKFGVRNRQEMFHYLKRELQ